MKIGYYPGCSLQGSGKEYSESLFAVAEKCGLTLSEVNDWNCCGATAAHALNHDLSIALPARTLMLAEEQGYEVLVVPCAACFGRLAQAQKELSAEPLLKERIESYLEKKVSGTVRLFTILEFLEEYVFPVVEPLLTHSLNHKTACYYGCLLAKPKDLSRLSQPEDPDEMERILERAGAVPVDWAYKTECCGAGLSVSKTEIVGRLSAKIVEDAVDRGAESIVVACPMCQMNLDLRRKEINRNLSKPTDIPVLFITQALGLSMGIQADKLGLNRHFVPTGKVVSCAGRKDR